MRAPIAGLIAAAVSVGAITAQQLDKSAKLAIPQNAAIVGRVVDASDRPVAGVLVVPLQGSPSRRGIRIHPVSVRLGAITNAGGQFRVQGLAAGQYYLVALPRNRLEPADRAGLRLGHAITYYPGVERVSDAKLVTVDARQPATADIALVPTHLADISGTAIASDGRPARGGRLGIAHGDNLFGIDSIVAPIGADGTFLVKDMPPGTYFLQLREGGWPPPRDVIPKVSGAKVIVHDGNVTRVTVMPIAMVKATGRVILDAAQRTLQASGIKIAANPVDWNGNPGPQRGGIVNADLTFELRTWPAMGFLRAWVGSQEWTIRRVRLNGIDVTDKDLDLRHDLSGLEVELQKPLIRD